MALSKILGGWGAGLKISVLAVLLLLSALGGLYGLYSRESGKNRAQAQELKAARQELELLKSNNRHLVEQRARDSQRLTDLAERSDLQAAANRLLNEQLTEALKNEKPDPGHNISDAVVDALCLRWHNANGYLPGVGQRSGTAGSLPPDPDAALCASWHGRLTVEGLIVWIGLLLDYAGEDVLYNSARRDRRAEMEARNGGL